MSILFCMPAYGGQVTLAHFQSCLNLKEELTLAGVEHDWCTTANESLITRARNTSVARFLQTDYERLMFLDADLEFSPDAVGKLWNLDADIACAAYRMKSDDAKLAAWIDGQLVNDLDQFKGPLPVDYAGTGFLMIKRTVFTALQERHPDWEHEEGHVGTCWAFFQTPVEDGIFLSEDYFFCKRAREAGFNIVLDPSIRLTHWGTKGYAS